MNDFIDRNNEAARPCFAIRPGSHKETLVNVTLFLENLCKGSCSLGALSLGVFLEIPFKQISLFVSCGL